MQELDEKILRQVIKPRPQESFKGTFGKVLLVGGKPHVKARPGDTFPPLPFPVLDEPCNVQTTLLATPQNILSLRRKMKLTQIQFGKIFGVSPKKVSAWEHGKMPAREQLCFHRR